MKLKGIQFLIFCLAACISAGFARAPKKIVSGEFAQNRQFPHQVSLQQNNEHFCGGSIIDATHILTAAHCIISDKDEFTRAEDIRVITGVIDRENRREDNVFRVNRAVCHGLYNPKIKKNDIAILALDRKIDFNKDQQPATLPTENTPPGTEVTASGWGLRDVSTRVSTAEKYLRKLPMTVISLDKCRYNYGDQIDAGDICVESAKGSGICKGDSGSPLTYKNTVIGIASRSAVLNSGIDCATGIPDIYTRVYYFIPWIKLVIKMTSPLPPSPPPQERF